MIKRSAPPMPRSGWIMMTFDSGTRLILSDLLYCPIEGELCLFFVVVLLSSEARLS
jgi:hypothetical protein